MAGRPSFLKRKREQDRLAKRKEKEERKVVRRAEADKERERAEAGGTSGDVYAGETIVDDPEQPKP